MAKRFAIVAVLVVGAVLWGSIGMAQSAATGALAGTVTDETGAGIPGATVQVTNQGTRTTRVAVTDDVGGYRVLLLPPGEYFAEVSAQGFKTAKFPEITVNVAETHTLNVSMSIGTSTETVTVEAAAAQVQTENATLGSVVGEQTVKSLPLTTRNYTQILHLAPGVEADPANAGEIGRNTQDVYVNGARTIDNNFQMDGAQINNFGTGRAGDWLGYTGISIPNPDAIKEFKIQTSLYDAQYGRGVGANVNVVTRSGTNDLHGSVFEFLRNTALNANDFFSNRAQQEKPVLRQNQFGGTIGGAIRKDKLFFFGSYQGTRQTNGIGSASLRSSFLPPVTDDRSAQTLGKQFCGQSGAAGGVAVACDGSNINPVALALLNAKLPNGKFFIPTPQTIQPDGVGFSVFSEPSTFSEDQYMANVDYVVTKNNTLSGRYFQSHDPQTLSFTGTSTIPGTGANSNFKNYNFVLKLTSIPKASLINEAMFTYKRNYGLLSTLTPITTTQIGMTPNDSGVDVMPLITVEGLFNTGGDWNDSFLTGVTAFTYGDHVSFTHGHHTIRAGFDIEHTMDNFDLPGPKRGLLDFLSFPDFLLGMSAAQNGSQLSNLHSISALAGLSDRQLRVTDYSLFIQDDFKVFPRFTLNLGLRWDLYGSTSEKRGRMSNFWPSMATNNDVEGAGTLTGYVVADNFPGAIPAGVGKTDNKGPYDGYYRYDNLGPRIGFSWQPLARSTHLVVRGGYGIFYSRTSGNDILQLDTLPPYSLREDLIGVNAANATFQVPFNPALPQPSAFPIFLPRTLTSTLSPELLAQDWNSPRTQQYSLNIQYEFLPNWLLEVGYVGGHGTRLLESRNLNQPFLASPENPINGQTTNTLATVPLRVPILGFGPSIFFFETNGNYLHNSLQTTVTKRISKGFQFQAAYTWAKTMDDVGNGLGQNSVWGGFYTADAHGDRRQAWGPADFDRTHRLVFNYLYELPTFHGGTGLAGKVLSGWAVSGVTTLQSGSPLTLQDLRAGSIFGSFFFSQLATLCPGETHSSIPTSGSVTDRLDNFLNASAFCPPVQIGDGTGFGTLGRGSVRGPGQNNFDIAISKATRVDWWKEGAAVDFRAEFFNAFNHPQFANPNVLLPFSSFGQITATRMSPRIIQFALKYSF
jgi:hypothetical protein